MLTEELVPLLNERAGLPQGTELALFEEIKPNLVERLADLDRPLEKVSLPLSMLVLNYLLTQAKKKSHAYMHSHFEVRSVAVTLSFI